MYTKILFLDIDGVLNNVKDNRGMNPELIKKLRRIIDNTNCDIVITSDWRRYGIGPDSPIQKQFIINGGDDIINYIIDKTSDDNSGRGYQINKWILDNKFTGSFAILDDIDWDMGNMNDHLIHIDGRYGLSDSDVDKAIKLLNWKF